MAMISPGQLYPPLFGEIRDIYNVRSWHQADVQKITTPIVDIPLTVPIQLSPTRQLLGLLKQHRYLRGTRRLKDHTMQLSI